MDINVIYRALDPFNTEEGRQIVVHMGCTKFYIVPNCTLFQSNFLFLSMLLEEEKNGIEYTGPLSLPWEVTPSNRERPFSSFCAVVWVSFHLLVSLASLMHSAVSYLIHISSSPM